MAQRSKKHTLRSIPSFNAGDGIIERLEEVMERAKAGELSMVAIATVERDGSSGRMWSTLHNAGTLLGSIEFMKDDILAKARCTD